MSAKPPKPVPGKFCWNELVTPNEAAARKFYRSLFSWRTEPFGKDGNYTLLKLGRNSAGGMMKSPEAGRPARWVPYVIVRDVDARIKKAKRLRAKVVVKPFDVAEVGRIAVLVDPQGATIGIITPAA